MVQIARRALGQFRGEANGGLGAEAEIARGIGQLAELPCGGFDDRVLPVARVHAPEPGEAVHHLVARGVGDACPPPERSTRTPARS